jgi:glycosyltransferase involved in cell wall biosynthesis
MPIKVLIIIPCFNEEKSIALLLEELLKITFSNKYRVEIVVVNDGSEDNTVEVINQLNVIILDLPVNIGIGGAVQTGLKYAFENDFEIAIQVDGDGQHPPMEILKMLKAQEENPSNLIIGSRFISKEGFQSSLFRRLGIFYLHWLNKILTQKNFYDITSGFRLFDKKAISLAARFYPDEYPEPESLFI